MTDRELLELAAKAAGIKLRPRLGGTVFEHDIGDNWWHVWNPRDNDGDAFRLAVKLGLVVDTLNGRVILAERLGRGHRDWTYGDTEDEVFDDDFATRRAIVRAAAEIGKAMTNSPNNAIL